MTNSKALLVIDVQVAMFDESDPVVQGEALLQKITSLIVKARTNGYPVIYIQHTEEAGSPLERGSQGWAIHPAIAPLEGDVTVEKLTPDSFYETGLHVLLQEMGVKELLLCGMQTEVCVDTTCRSAFSHGYAVTLVSDAHGTWHSPQLKADQIIAHHNHVLRLFATVMKEEEVVVNGV